MAAQVPERDEKAVRALVENIAATFADWGFPRMAARVLILEMVSEEDTLTASELGERLGASPAAISNAVKYLTHIGMLTKEAVPNSRRDRYRVTDQSWFTTSVLKAGFIERLAASADEGIVAVGGQDTNAGKKLSEMRDFYSFLGRGMADLMRQWEREQARAKESIDEPA